MATDEGTGMRLDSGAHTGATGWEALIPLDFNRLRQFTNEPVPHHLKRWWFSLGGTPAFLFFIQITTGILLTFYYQPTADAAYESVRRITEDINYGWFLRGIHKWSANLMIVTVILHLLRVFFTRAYEHPRTLNWVFGVAILLVTFSFGFTGYSLIYEQLSFWGATVAANLTASVPLLGEPMAVFLRGGPEVGDQTLTRLYLLHIGLLPAAMVAIVGLHLTFVRLHGVTEYEFDKTPKDAKPGGATGAVVTKFLALASGLAAAGAVVAALSGWRFDLVGYRFLPGTSMAVFFLIAAILGAGAYGLYREHLLGLMVFLAGTVFGFTKLLRDLLLSESPNPGLWTVLLAGVVVLLVLAIVVHRRFTEEEKEDEPKHFNFFPDHMTTEILIGTALLGGLTLLTLVFPPEMGVKANPLVTPEHIKPEWYFYFQFRMLKLTSLQASVILTGVMMAVLFLWPWIDRFLERIAPGRNLPIYIGILGFIWFLAFTVWEALLP